ncbi:MAG: AAA family ATPase [Thermodesulfobacteriota bacterium]
MGITIGLAGKGGTGKTTLAGLAIQYLARKGRTPILAVDADSNANLNEVLGIKFDATLSEAREEMKRSAGQVSITKDMLIEMRVNEALVETSDFDLIVMGRPEGPGCYCAANTVLASVLEKLLDNYPYLVIDNEAGMEHLSRLTTKKVDVFYVVSDASRRGLTAAIRIWHLVDELKIKTGAKHLILNQVRGRVSPDLLAEIEKEGLVLSGVIPEDDQIYEWDQTGRPTSRLDPDNPAVAAAYAIFDQTLDHNLADLERAAGKK